MWGQVTSFAPAVSTSLDDMSTGLSSSFAGLTSGLASGLSILTGGEAEDPKQKKLQEEFAKKSKEQQAAAQRRALDKAHRSKPAPEETEYARLERVRMARDKAEKDIAKKEAAKKERREKREEEARKKEEAEQRELERVEALHTKVSAWLKKNKFPDTTSQKKTGMFSWGFPLHVAVKENSADMIDCLLQTGADVAAKNSSGQLPQELAQKLDRSGSHAAVLEAFARAGRRSQEEQEREARRSLRREERKAKRDEELRIGYTPGEPVEYCSSTARKWIRTKVISRLTSGNYDLECKLNVRAERIRRSQSYQARSSRHGRDGSRERMKENLAGTGENQIVTNFVTKPSPWSKQELARTAYDISHLDLKPTKAVPSSHEIKIGPPKEKKNVSFAGDAGDDEESLDSEELGIRFESDSDSDLPDTRAASKDWPAREATVFDVDAAVFDVDQLGIRAIALEDGDATL